MTDYLVLIPCRNDNTGARFEPGDVVDESDFPAAVIDNWLTIDPPVLMENPAGVVFHDNLGLSAAVVKARVAELLDEEEE